MAARMRPILKDREAILAKDRRGSKGREATRLKVRKGTKVIRIPARARMARCNPAWRRRATALPMELRLRGKGTALANRVGTPLKLCRGLLVKCLVKCPVN